MSDECKHKELLIKHEIICCDCGEKGSGNIDIYQDLLICWETRSEVIRNYIEKNPDAIDVPLMRSIKNNIDQCIKELKFTIYCQQVSTVGKQYGRG